MENVNFQEFLDAVRREDPAAIEKLVSEQEPLLRELIRAKLAGNRLRRVTDSTDVCQSVLINFLQHTAKGRFNIDNYPQLSKVLRTMALNRLRDLARREAPAGTVEALPSSTDSTDEQALTSEDSTPSQSALRREIVALVRAALSERGRIIQERRAAGSNWEEIAAELKEAPNSLRVRFAREMQRVIRKLGLEELEVAHARLDRQTNP